MHVALIIGGSLLGVGAILYLHHRLTQTDRLNEIDDNSSVKPSADTGLQSEQSEESSECCGLHLVCEKFQTAPVDVDSPVYFDDEELDRFTGIDADKYSDDEIEEFRDILLTIRAEELPLWAKSIEMRNIELPSSVRDELMLLVSEPAMQS